jgi:hypothetical protein
VKNEDSISSYNPTLDSLERALAALDGLKKTIDFKYRTKGSIVSPRNGTGKPLCSCPFKIAGHRREPLCRRRSSIDQSCHAHIFPLRIFVCCTFPWQRVWHVNDVQEMENNVSKVNSIQLEQIEHGKMGIASTRTAAKEIDGCRLYRLLSVDNIPILH